MSISLPDSSHEELQKDWLFGSSKSSIVKVEFRFSDEFGFAGLSSAV